MGWIFACVIFLTIIFFLVRSPGFRKVALGGVVAIAAWLIYNEFSSQDRLRRERAAIRPSDIELANLTLSNTYGSSWQVSGLVTNHSRYELSGLTFNITVQNCITHVGTNPAPDCHVVGQTQVNYWTTIPSGQQRTMSENVSFEDMPRLSDWSWSYSDVQTTANLGS